MHTAKARASCASEQSLTTLPDWREALLFSAQERAALAVAEALTHPAEAERLASAILEAKRMFTMTELTQLTYAVATTNAWNRLALADGLAPASETARSRSHGVGL